MANIPQLHVKIVPWMSRYEVRQVYEELYSDDILQQKHALGRIDVWKSRHLHKLPLAFESTAALIQAKLEHQRAGPAVSDDRHLRTFYSMAILRFVNHVTEKGQGKATAQPVHLLAAQVGVPEWIVDLRHEATHGSLPSLSMLRAAANWALQWLKYEFWEVQKEGSFRQELRHTTDTNTKLDTLRDLLVDYQQRRFKDVVEENSNTNITDIIADLDTVFFDLRGEIYDCLIEDGYLISTEQQLSSLGIDVKELLTDDNMIIPQKIRKFWKPLVRLLSKHDLLSGFLLNLASCITNEHSLRNWQLCAWIVKLTPKEKKKQAFINKDDISIKDSLSFRRLLKKCAIVESPYTGGLIRLLTDKVGAKFLSEEKKRLLQKVSSLYYNRVKGDTGIETGFKTVRDILTFKNDVQVDLDDSTDNPWVLCTEVEDWSKYPLGVLPNQKISYKSLELFTDGDSIDEKHMDTESVTNNQFMDGGGADDVIMVTDCWLNDQGERLDLSSKEVDLVDDNMPHVERKPSEWSEQMLEYIKQNVGLIGS